VLDAGPKLKWEARELGDAAPLWAVLDEQTGVPARFEALFADPALELWSAGDSLIGTSLTCDIGGGRAFEGRVWGRDLVSAAGGSQLRLWGFDDAYRLHVCREYRTYRGTLSAVANAAAEGAGLTVRVTAQALGRFSSSENQTVQYGETAWEFLRRLAFQLGTHLTSFRGELHIGGGPGAAGGNIEVDLEGAEWLGAEVELSESWCDRPAAYHLPLLGVPYAGTPKLSGTGPAEAVVKPSTTEKALGRLKARGAASLPAGVAATPADRSAIGDALAAADKRRGTTGVMTIPAGSAGKLTPGAVVSLRRGRHLLHPALTVAGLEHRLDGATRHAIIYFGRPSIPDTPPPLRPAVHLWPAVVAGNYKADRGRVDVRPIGWHPDSAALAARLGVWSVKPGPAAVRVPLAGELVLIGFEGGAPDAPAVLTGLHDAEAPAAAAGEFVVKAGDSVWRTLFDKAGLDVRLEKAKLDLAVDKPMGINAAESFKLKSKKVDFEKS
jgi:hypothetical protein